MNPQITALYELQKRDRQLGRLERRLELIPKRIKELEARLLAREDDAEARLELARALSQRGDLGEAVTQLERVSAAPDQVAAALSIAGDSKPSSGLPGTV